jgi:hypothetical protein
MATKKRQQTMAKREREQNVRDRRAEKLLKKRNLAAERAAGTGETPNPYGEPIAETDEAPADTEPTPEQS